MITRPRSLLRAAAFVALTAITSSLASAGTPLICHPFDIANAKSIPGGNGDKGTDPNYDRANLVNDTLNVLTPDLPVIARMETLRRATIYATSGIRVMRHNERYTAQDRELSTGLRDKLRERIAAAKTDDARALALFDLGYFTSALRQAHITEDINGYDLMTQAAKLRPQDAEIQFALALATAYPKRQEHAEWLARAKEAAKSNQRVAANLHHFRL